MARSSQPAAISSRQPTIPPHMQRSRPSVPPVKRWAGFGTVGSSVARVLAAAKLPGLELTMIYNRDVARKRTSEAAKRVPASVIWTEDFNDVLRSDADIVVELMGGLDPAERWTKKLLA